MTYLNGLYSVIEDYLVLTVTDHKSGIITKESTVYAYHRVNTLILLLDIGQQKEIQETYYYKYLDKLR